MTSTMWTACVVAHRKDAIIHLDYNHDFTHMEHAGQSDRAALAAR